MTEIAEPTARERSPDELVAAVELKAKKELEEGLEAVFEEEAAKLLSAGKGLRRQGFVQRTIVYKGFVLNLKAPRLRLPSGKFRLPPRFEELSNDPTKAQVLRRYGVPSRKVGPLLEELNGEKVPGTSPTSVSREDIKAGEAALKKLADRDYHGDPPIVAVSLDGTAIGTKGRKRTVMIVVGVKADGSRWLLDTFIAQDERTEDIARGLRRLVGKGISPDAYWVADGGAGIRSALQEIGATNIGMCTTHAVRLVAKKLPDKETEKRFRLKINWALSADDPGIALQRLEAVEAELRELGHEEAGDAVQRHKQGMVVTQKLGLKGELRRQLRSTNVLVEGQNHTVKKQLTDVSNWQDKRGRDEEAGDQMRLRWVAKTGLELEVNSWRRLADPKALVELGKRLGLNGLDLEAILSSLPPSLEVNAVGTPLEEMAELDRPDAKWLAAAPDAVWFGAPDALAKLGVTPGAPVGADQLARAMRGRHTDSDKAVRTPADVNVVLDEAGTPRKAKVRGVLNLSWQLTASPALMRRWRAGTAEQRAELEAAFWDAATAAVERATRTSEPGHGFAAAAVLSRPPPDAPEAESVLRISGFAVGVTRGAEGKLLSPRGDKAISAVCRSGEDAAQAVLEHAFERETLQPDISTHPPEEPSPAVLAGVELRALQKAPRMVRTADGLATIAAGEAAAREGLAVACGEASGWWKANRAAAVRQIAAVRLRDPARAKADRWFPLRPGSRLLLGEERARELRAAAARLVGRASGNRDLARQLAGSAGEPLAELAPAVARVEKLAEAVAARREIDRRGLFERAAARAPAGESSPAAALPVFDTEGRPAMRPVGRHGRTLGRLASALQAYSEALAPQVAALSPGRLGSLLRSLGEPWKDLDGTAGLRHSRLERRREGELDNLLRAEYLDGLQAEAARGAEARRDAAAAFDASSDRHRVQAERLRAELARIDAEIDDARRQATGTEAERFVARHPEAAVYDAAFAEAQARELARGRQTEDVGMDVGL